MFELLDDCDPILEPGVRESGREIDHHAAGGLRTGSENLPVPR